MSKINLVLDVDIVLRSIYHRALTITRTSEGLHIPCLQEYAINQEFEKIKHSVEIVSGEQGYDEFKWYYCTTDELNKYSNFRYQLLSDYKNNRKSEGNVLDRLFLKAARDSLFELLENDLRLTKRYLETDDEVSIIASYIQDNNQDVIIVSSDKDFKINFNTINPITLNYHKKDESLLYKLLLLGDAADGILGIKGYGIKTVEKLFEGKSIDEIKTIVEDIYDKNSLNIDLHKDLLTPLTHNQVVFNRHRQISEIRLLTKTLNLGELI